MGIQEVGGKCKKCGDVIVRRKTANHILHLLLSVFTMGFWLVIWLLVAIQIGGWRCGTCGRKASRRLMN